ncbi:DUF3027 domain-containing protein [Bifidobacterium sp. SO1]|nr:DUF3027 domain-containing protein [Bifidobacterium sp. SO1]MBT1161078.1 DUF3027 domain-containing protein [Bifidobacterium sp. SO1]
MTMQDMAQTQEPAELARAVALDMADEPEQVGAFVESVDLGDHVTDFRFVCGIRGYEGWQWSVTLYHDEETKRWTVNESSLIPTETALRPPQWVPWKDRLEPTDLSVTDSIGTDPDDPRIEDGFRRTQPADDTLDAGAVTDTVEDANPAAGSDDEVKSGSGDSTGCDGVADGTVSEEDEGESARSVTSEQDIDDAVDEFDLSRRHVLSALGRSQTAKRWYEGPHGPKSLSTKTADGNVCANCGFFIQLKGELNVLFGVCANKWSPDDGRVVSVDHGCGEHSEIAPPEPTHLWVQSKPAYDDYHIDVIAQTPREENGQIELLERLTDAGIKVGKGVIVLKSQL